jgi:hypothetical protein
VPERQSPFARGYPETIWRQRRAAEDAQYRPELPALRQRLGRCFPLLGRARHGVAPDLDRAEVDPTARTVAARRHEIGEADFNDLA